MTDLPRIPDAGGNDCLTPDGIPLLRLLHSAPSTQIFTAVRLSRTPLGRIMLPETLSKPATWASR
ncbi:hypothetical protein [Sphingomonas adhaesiva]|uniref:hypothetical protein n=1 Tax=Sphingomonas adhaesiva TaxID=28212 RepID=UPI002FF9CC30